MIILGHSQNNASRGRGDEIIMGDVRLLANGEWSLEH